MTVKAGKQSVSVTKAANTTNWGASAVEVKLPYTINEYGVVENVTIAMGASNWSGNIAISSLERSQKVTAAMLNQTTSGSPTATADGMGYTFTLAPAATAPGSSEDYRHRLYAVGTPIEGLKNHTADLSFEFDFAATDLPDLGNKLGYMGWNWPQWAGPTFVITDQYQNGLNMGIQNSGGDLYLCTSNAKNSTGHRMLKLGAKNGQTFHLRVVWRQNSDLEVYVNGAYVGVLTMPPFFGILAGSRGKRQQSTRIAEWAVIVRKIADRMDKRQRRLELEKWLPLNVRFY